jgi:hypothetical protein
MRKSAPKRSGAILFVAFVVIAIAKSAISQVTPDTVAPEQETRIVIEITMMDVDRETLPELGIPFARLINAKRLVVADRSQEPIQMASLTDREATLLVDLLRATRAAKILAQPTIAVTDGRPANFSSIGKAPVPVPQADGSTTEETRQIGVSVDVTAKKQPTGKLSVEIRAEHAERDDSRTIVSNGVEVPGIKTRWFDTGFEVESGKTVMLFGDPGLLVLITPVVMPGLTVAPQPPPTPISVEAVKIELATRLYQVHPRRVIHDSPEKAQLYVHPLQADPEASDLQSEVALPAPARKPSKRSKRTGNSQTTKEALRELRNDVSALRGDVRQLINILEQQKSEAEKRQLPPARKPSAIDQSGDVSALDAWPSTHPTEANPPDDTVEPYTIHINPAVIGQLRQGSAVYERISEEDEGIRQIRVVLDSGDARNSEFAEIPDVIGAVDQGWRPREDDGLDFYVQLRDEQFEAFVDGAKIDVTVDSNVAAIRHIYGFVGDNRLPRQLPE